MIGSGSRGGRGLVRAYQYPILSLFDEMNRLFEDAVPSSGRGAVAFKPQIDLTETEKEYVLHGEFPGLEASEISIELKDNTLTLSGEKRAVHEHKEGNRVHVERSFGSFSRSIPFPVEVDEDNTTAEMKNGVLTVRVPKSQEVLPKTKKVSIKTS